MHKLESFALSCGSKISKPQIEKTYYPVLDKRFICISKYTNDANNNYDYWDDVIFHIKPYLDQSNIAILEIGPNDKDKIFYTKSFNHLNRLQTNYLLDKSLLYLGNHNFYAHVASFYEKPIVCVNKNDYIDCSKPYWNDGYFILPDSDEKPVFNKIETPKSINSIMPEEVSRQVLDALGIPHNLNFIETIHIGKHYGQRYVDIVPGDFDPTSFSYKGNITLRLDKNLNLAFLNRCQQFEGINVVIDKPLPRNALLPIKDKIQKIVFFINKKTTQEDLENLFDYGHEVEIVCDNEKIIGDLRFKFIDHNIKLYKKNSKKDLNTKTFSDLEFLSRKNIISNGQPFNSYLSLSAGQNVASVENKKEMWEDLDFIRIYRKNLT